MADQTDVLRRVDSALREHPHLRSVAIQTSRQCGINGEWVILDGAVDSFFEKQMAQEAVRYVEGIPQIDNRLIVRTVI
jgi:osmotically-inducible protein OsmY